MRRYFRKRQAQDVIIIEVIIEGIEISLSKGRRIRRLVFEEGQTVRQRDPAQQLCDEGRVPPDTSPTVLVVQDSVGIE